MTREDKDQHITVVSVTDPLNWLPMLSDDFENSNPRSRTDDEIAMSLIDYTGTKARRSDYRYHFNVIANAISQMIDRTNDERILRSDTKVILKMQSIDLNTMQRQIFRRITANYSSGSRPRRRN